MKPDVCWLDPLELESNPSVLDIGNRRSQWKIKLINNNNVIQFVLISSADNGLSETPFTATHIKCENKNRTIAEVEGGSYKRVLQDKDRTVHYYFYPTIRTTLFNLTFQYWQSFKVIALFSLNPVLLREIPSKNTRNIQTDNKITSALPQSTVKPSPAEHTKTTKLYVFASESPYADLILQDYDRLLNDHRHSDIKLIVKDHHFQCHKSILAARCEVFADLIKTNGSDTMTLPSIDVDTAADLLHYIYTGRAPNIEKTANRLMVAATVFDLKLLKFRCESTLKHDVKAGKSLKLLRLTDGAETSMTKCPTLKEELMEALI